MAEGKKFDGGKLRMDLIPVEAIEGIARVLTFGAEKYGDRNWEQGIKFGRLYAALLRHLFAWFKGEDTDPESKLNHIDHVLACATFLRTYQARAMVEFDDRPEVRRWIEGSGPQRKTAMGLHIDIQTPATDLHLGAVDDHVGHPDCLCRQCMGPAYKGEDK
jgi:hypothetical protein